MTDSTVTHQPIKFTDARLKDLKPEAKRYQVRDTEQRGLVCVVHPAGKRYPNGRRILQVYARAKGINAPIRCNICEVGDLPMTALKGQPSVRSRAAEILAQLRQGTNPNEARREQQAEQRIQAERDRASSLTLGEVFEQYLATKPLTESSVVAYRLSATRDLGDWLNRPLVSITGAMTVARYAELAKTSRSVARSTMVLMRAVHRFANDYYSNDDDLPFGRTPTDKLNRIVPGWMRTAARTRRLELTDIAPWLSAVRDMATETRSRGEHALAADYLEMLLLTGFRRQELASMRWSDVDLNRLTLTARKTKNHSDHTLPISRRVAEILQQRQAASKGPLVFGLKEIGTYLKRVEQRTELRISAHDLRRTWASCAEKAGVSTTAIKRVLNHSVSGDITATHYNQISVEDLRPIMQKVEDFILRRAEQRSADVIELRSVA